jgi:hypothetical protein
MENYAGQVVLLSLARLPAQRCTESLYSSGRLPRLPKGLQKSFSKQATMNDNDMTAVLERLDRIETNLEKLVRQQTVKDWYTTHEAAEILGKAEFTVREWCRRGRINAEKRHSGRGAYPAWVIGHAELLRYQRDGLLPYRRRA